MGSFFLIILAILDDTAKVVQSKADCKENGNYFLQSRNNGTIIVDTPQKISLPLQPDCGIVP